MSKIAVQNYSDALSIIVHLNLISSSQNSVVHYVDEGLSTISHVKFECGMSKDYWSGQFGQL